MSLLALLAYPGAFLLVSVYSESLFLLLSLATFWLAGPLAISIGSRSFWGFLRFGAFLFPLHMAATRLHERQPLWIALLLASSLIQVAALLQFVAFTTPAP